MKILIIVCLFFTSIYAQEWVQQNPNPNSMEIEGVVIVNDSTWLLSNIFSLIRTTDSGKSFKTLLKDKIIYKIFYFQNRLILVYDDYRRDNNMKIMKSDNLGETFDIINDEVRAGNYLFVDTSNGWNIGSNLKTTDGGRTWSRFLQESYLNLYFIDSLNGIMIKQFTNYISKTTDGGFTWDKMYIMDSSEYAQFVTLDSIVYLRTIYNHYKYTFGTDTVYRIEGLPYPCYEIAVKTILKKDNILINYNYFFSEIYYYQTYGTYEYFYYFNISTDKGVTWQKRKTPDVRVFTYAILSDHSFLAFCEGGTIQKSTNLGESWFCINKPSIKASDVFFIDENNGWIAGSNLLKTTNGGNEWEYIYTEMELMKIYFKDMQNGFSYTPGYFLKTTDGGYHWDTLHQADTIRQIYFKNELNGYAIGNGVYFKTTDGGQNWNYNSDSVFTNTQLNSMNFCTADLGYVVGNSKGFKTTNGGTTWIKDLKLVGNKVFFIDSLTGIKAKDYVLARTTNGGNSFYDIINHQSPADSWSDLQFVNEGTGFVFFNFHNIIMKTSDKGITWENIHRAEREQSIYFVNENLGWAAGSHGEILKYTADPLLFTEENILPNKFFISQNYPNPFNPSTRIKYDVPKKGFISIKVYNILGKDIAQLVNEEKNAGAYVVEFDGSRLSSGIYFYQIQAGEFIETKKMVLMK
ncbi:MAG TPA: T9SS type A sorting domain-containing protein [Ignavibacteriaceae bacterium]|nr:T9SS type A sorting domain-containing protein [Ignavibacteriaceae bacterium]